jgi:cellobiose phosphorylase
VTNLRSCGCLAYSNNERAKQLLYALDDHVWCMKITALEESADFAILDTEILFSNLKSHELSIKGHPKYDASLTSRLLLLVLVLVAMMLTQPTLLSHLLWSLSYLLWP